MKVGFGTESGLFGVPDLDPVKNVRILTTVIIPFTSYIRV